MIRKIYLLLFVIMLFVFPNVKGENCFSLDIFLDLKSKIRWEKIDSQYQFPWYREHDILRIERITFINDGKCSISNINHVFKIVPPSKCRRSESYYTFNVILPEIKVGEKIILQHNESGYYYFIKNNNTLPNYKYWHNAIDLDQLGDWNISHQIEDKLNKYGAKGYSIFVFNYNIKHWDDIKGFRVYPESDLLLIEYNSNINRLTNGIYFLTIIILIFTILMYFNQRHSNSILNKYLHNIDSYFKSINKNKQKNKRR